MEASSIFLGACRAAVVSSRSASLTRYSKRSSSWIIASTSGSLAGSSRRILSQTIIQPSVHFPVQLKRSLLIMKYPPTPPDAVTERGPASGITKIFRPKCRPFFAFGRFASNNLNILPCDISINFKSYAPERYLPQYRPWRGISEKRVKESSRTSRISRKIRPHRITKTTQNQLTKSTKFLCSNYFIPTPARGNSNGISEFIQFYEI